MLLIRGTRLPYDAPRDFILIMDLVDVIHIINEIIEKRKLWWICQINKHTINHTFSRFTGKLISTRKRFLPSGFLFAVKPIESVVHCFYNIKLFLFCDEVADLRFQNDIKILSKAVSKVLRVQNVALGCRNF